MSQQKMLFVIQGGSEWMGGLHYVKNLIKTVKSTGGQVAVDLLVYAPDQVSLFADMSADIDSIHVYNDMVAAAGLPRRAWWWLQRKLGNSLHPALDNFIRAQGYQFAYPCLPRKDFKYYRFADWIPDFQYRHYPEGSNPVEIQGRKDQNSFVTANAPLIYLSSQHALRDCEELFPASKGKLAVMQFCVYADPLHFPDPLEEVRSAYNIPRKYFMVSNLLAPTKNLEVVIAALGMLKKKGLSVPVVVSGDIHDYRNPGFKHTIFQRISAENVREEVIMLGLMPRIRQKQLLANALAIVQPSRFEGWNTLVEEAKWMGKEIVLSDIPVHLEQAPELATYFKDNDAADLAAKLEAIYHNAADKPAITAVAVSPAYQQNIARFAKHFMDTSLGAG